MPNHALSLLALLILTTELLFPSVTFFPKYFLFVPLCLLSWFYFRLRFLGKVLSVERVGTNTKNTDSLSESQSRKDSSAPLPLLLKDSSNPVNSVYAGEPIAPRLGVDYPFPPQLEYVPYINAEVLMPSTFL